MLHIFLADGFEEIEALATMDILRRCGLEVQTVSITGKRLITGAHGISTMVDSLYRYSGVSSSECIILPGGMPGAKNLMAYDGLRKTIINHNKGNRLIAAICAAPMILGQLGLLAGKRATCYPGFEDYLTDAVITGKLVEESNNIITGKGPGAVTEFAFAIARHFVSEEVVKKVQSDMMLEAATAVV